MWATIYFCQGLLPPTLGADTELPLYSPYVCRLGYHPGANFIELLKQKKLLKHENSWLILHMLLAKISCHVHCLRLVFSCCLLSITIEWGLGRQSDFTKQGIFCLSRIFGPRAESTTSPTLRSNHGEVSCLRTQVSRPGQKATLC